MRGYYAAVSGTLTAVRRMDAVINNLANLETPGFKQERTASISFSEQMVMEQAATQTPRGTLALVSAAQAPELDFSEGSVQSTGRSLDIALDGPGFLVTSRDGSIGYTRDGSLVLDEQGRLATSTGALVLGSDGPIEAPAGAEITIGTDGTIAADGAVVNRLRIVEFGPVQSLQRAGRNELVASDPGVVPQESLRTVVHQGYIEGSNVDMSGMMTSMMELQRAYEANQRMIRYQDEMMSHSVNEIARPAN